MNKRQVKKSRIKMLELENEALRQELAALKTKQTRKPRTKKAEE